MRKVVEDCDDGDRKLLTELKSAVLDEVARLPLESEA